jgi:hypothetical protein
MKDLTPEEKDILRVYLQFSRVQKYIETEHPMYKFVSTTKLNHVYEGKHKRAITKDAFRDLYDRGIIELRHQGPDWYVGIDIKNIPRIQKVLA